MKILLVSAKSGKAAGLQVEPLFLGIIKHQGKEDPDN